MIGSEACNISIQTLRAILLIWSVPESRDPDSASTRAENGHHKQISTNHSARTCQFSRHRNILYLSEFLVSTACAASCKARSGTAVRYRKGERKRVNGEKSPLCLTASGTVVDKSGKLS